MSYSLERAIRPTSDFPKKGVCYWDTTPIFESPKLLREAVRTISTRIQSSGANYLAAIEAKGFPLGGALAHALDLPLVFVRKPGLSPGAIREANFEKEYGHGTYQIKEGVLSGQERVYLLYDILAGAGATTAAVRLIEKSRAQVVGAGYIVELEYLHGRETLDPLPIFSLLQISEEARYDHQANQF